MIRINNLTKTYTIGGETIKAVDDASLTIARGDFLAILGHSGSGKTTFLNLLGGLTRPDSGTVIIDDVDIWQITDNELAHLRNDKMNFIFQFASLIPTLTVLENVLLPTAFGKEQTKDKEALDKAVAFLRRVKMEDKIASYPSQLSGGQQRRVAIARAFINEPEIILADEPTGDLDEETEQEVIDLFRNMNREQKTTFLIVTHSSDLARQSDRQYRMTAGVLGPLDA